MDIYNLREAGSLREITENFCWNIPEQYNVAYDACDKHAESNRPALFYENLQNEKRAYTFSDMKKISDQLAGYFVEHGVRHGDRIVIMLPNTPEAAATFLAALKTSAIAVPLSILYGSESLAIRLVNCEPKIIVTTSQQIEKIHPDINRLPSLELILLVGKGRESARRLPWGKILVESWDEDTPDQNYADKLATEGGFHPHSRERAHSHFRLDNSKDDPALLMYTSGTTGVPKGVLLPHRAILSRIVAIQLAHFPFPKKDDLFWSPVEWAWVGGCVNSLLVPWILGVPILCYEREASFNPQRALQMLQIYRVKNCFFPPAALNYFRRHMDEITTKYELSIRTLHSGGEALSSELFQWTREKFGITINEIYGVTEAGIVVGNCAPLEPSRPGSMGKVIPGHEVGVFNTSLDKQLVEVDGLLAVRADQPSIFLGYWKDEELTKKTFRQGWYIPGDIVSVDSDKYFWFSGRRDVIVKVAGYRVSPLEVESLISRHEAVGRCAVLAVPDKERGHVLKAYVVINEGYEASQTLAESIQNFAKQISGLHQYPKQIEFVKEIPNIVSRVQKKKGMI